MIGNKNHTILTVLVLVAVVSVANGGSITYLDVLKRITNVRGDVRTSLRVIRELAVQSGLIPSSKNETSTPAPALSDQQPLELRMDPEESEESDEEAEEDDEEVVAITEGRKKGGGSSNNNNIVVAGGGGDGGHGHEAYYEVYEEDGGKKGKKKKGKKNRKKRKKHRGWKKHMKKAVPIGLGILALKALLLHFILKKLVLATALSLLLSKKSLLVSSLIALKLLFSQQHSSDKSESSKLEVVHIPIRKETGFHKKIQLQNIKAKPKPKQMNSTPKPQHTFNHYGSGSLIKHTHQQMEDFGGKYIPMGYESTQFSYDLTTPTTYLDSLPEGSEDNFFDVNDLQYIRREGWDGWTGWNRGEEGSDPNNYAGNEPSTSTAYSVSSNYDQPYSYNSHGNGARYSENNNIGQRGTQTNYKQRNLSLMKYRRKRKLEGDA